MTEAFQYAARLQDKADAQKCPDGFRCGHCVAADAKSKAAGRAAFIAQVDLADSFAGSVAEMLPVAISVRTFTRVEVLMALRALHADTGVVAGKEALRRAIHVFERIE
jgi:hypothetical protein